MKSNSLKDKIANYLWDEFGAKFSMNTPKRSVGNYSSFEKAAEDLLELINKEKIDEQRKIKRAIVKILS